MIDNKLVELITKYCDDNNLGLMCFSDGVLSIIVTGPKGMNPNRAATMAAHMLLTGILGDLEAPDNAPDSVN